MASASTGLSLSPSFLMPYSNPAAVPPQASLVREQARWGCTAFPASGQKGRVKSNPHDCSYRQPKRGLLFQEKLFHVKEFLISPLTVIVEMMASQA